MKVELRISNDTLMAVNSLLQGVYELPVSTDERENIYKSIGFDLADKFDSKAKSLVRKASLFTAGKKNKLTLKFHEAWALQQILMDAVVHVQNDYQQTLIIKVIHHLDQKTV